jgi:peptidase MA superfamily protein
MSGRRRFLAVLALTIAASIGAPVAAGGTLESFGEATAVATFGESIRVEQPAILQNAPVRAEALVRAAGSDRTFLAEIPTPPAGESTLQYTYATPFGGLFPNTQVQLGFRLTFDDGRIVDSPTTTILYDDDRFEWRTIEGPLVRVHWIDGDEAFGRRALDIGERAIEEATTLLGVDETRPIDFFVYADQSAFRDVLGPAIQENVGGVALAEIRTLFANIEPSQVNDAWVRVVIPHELTHLVFDTATRNPYHEPPHWLNEGLADYLAQGYNAGARGSVENAARSGAIMPLRALVGRFPFAPDRFSLAYDESVSAIDFLIRTYGQDALVGLIRSYADGVSDDVAFRDALGVDVAAFEAAWLADLGTTEPLPYGPRPAPPGPLPPGWTAAVQPTPKPGSSEQPLATPRPASSADSLAGPILLGVIGLFAGLLVAGLFVVARGLSRGEPLFGPGLPDVAEEADGGADDGGDEIGGAVALPEARLEQRDGPAEPDDER